MTKAQDITDSKNDGNDSIELHFEITGKSDQDDKKYKVIKVNLSEKVRLSKYALKRVLIKKNQFEMYPTMDKFLK